MSTREKAAKILLVLALLFGMSAISIMMAGEQQASVGLFFGPDNTNETVLKAQTRLHKLGLYDGNISGLFGWRTRNALYEFQESNGLVRNGILDIPTQNALFAVVVPEEYVTIDYTREGNAFLREWIGNTYNQRSKAIEWQGKLTIDTQDSFYAEDNLPTRFLIDVDGVQYSVRNISTNDLGQFVGSNVILNGFYFGRANNLGLRTIFVNYVVEGDIVPAIDISYTEAGNIYLAKWIRKYYQEPGEDIDMFGALTLGDVAVRYQPQGNATRVILTSNGVSYSIENISINTIEVLQGQNVSLHGRLLEDLNELGFRTVVINYVFPSPVSSTLSQ